MTASWNNCIVELIQMLENGLWECREVATGKIYEIAEEDLSNFLPF